MVQLEFSVNGCWLIFEKYTDTSSYISFKTGDGIKRLGSVSDRILFQRTKEILTASDCKTKTLFEKELAVYLYLSDPHGTLFINPLEADCFNLVYVDSSNDYFELAVFDESDKERFVNAIKPYGPPNMMYS